jgi:cyclopropane fatty-acyl-phospholipid synthase-like methyltransferase
LNFFRKLSFNLWYYQDPPWDTGVSPPELLEYIETHPPGKALDLGCGTGTNVITLAQSGWGVTGVDFAHQAIKRAKKKILRAGVKVDLRLDDVTKLIDLTGPYDLILDMGCFQSLSSKKTSTYIRNIARLLDQNGTFIMYGFFKDPPNSGTGLSETHLKALSAHLQLIKRKDGTERGLLPSAWFTYQHKNEGL